MSAPPTHASPQHLGYLLPSPLPPTTAPGWAACLFEEGACEERVGSGARARQQKDGLLVEALGCAVQIRAQLDLCKQRLQEAVVCTRPITLLHATVSSRGTRERTRTMMGARYWW